MNFFSYLRVELNRIFHLRTVYMVILLTMISPIVGYNLRGTMFAQTTSSDLIVKPCITGALVSGVLFALLTLIEFARVNKQQIGALTNNIVPPFVINMMRTFAIGTIAILSVTITALMYLPYVVMKMGYVFDAYTYLNSFFIFMPSAVLLSILVISAFCQIFYRMAAFYNYPKRSTIRIKSTY